jgi:hypothetical protein
MKKNIKLSEKHSELVRQNMANFKNDVLNQVAQNMNYSVGGLVKPHSKLFGQVSWTLG